MTEDKLLTCRIKHRMENIIRPVMAVLGGLILILMAVGWAGYSALTIYSFISNGDMSGLVVMGGIDALVLIVMYMAVTLPPPLSLAPRIACSTIMLLATILIAIKAAIIDYSYAIGGAASVPSTLLIVVGSIVAYLVLLYAFMVALCEFEKIIKCPKVT